METCIIVLHWLCPQSRFVYLQCLCLLYLTRWIDAADLESRDSSHFLLTRMHVYCKPPPTWTSARNIRRSTDTCKSCGRVVVNDVVGPQRGQNTDMSCGHVQLNFSE